MKRHRLLAIFVTLFFICICLFGCNKSNNSSSTQGFGISSNITIFDCPQQVDVSEKIGNIHYDHYYNYYIPLSLKEVEIRNGNSIPPYAFEGCGLLTKITIPISTQIVNNSAFASCQSLSKITLPKSLLIINDNAFQGCDNLNEITFNGTINNWNNISKSLYWNYNFSDCAGNHYYKQFNIKCTDGIINV